MVFFFCRKFDKVVDILDFALRKWSGVMSGWKKVALKSWVWNGCKIENEIKSWRFFWMKSWCMFGSLLVESWCIFGEKLVQSWCILGEKLVQSWCILGEKLVQSWCILGAFLVQSFHPYYFTSTRKRASNFAPRMHQLCTNFAPTLHQSFLQKNFKSMWIMTPGWIFFLRKDVLCGWLLGAVESKGLLWDFLETKLCKRMVPHVVFACLACEILLMDSLLVSAQVFYLWYFYLWIFTYIFFTCGSWSFLPVIFLLVNFYLYIFYLWQLKFLTCDCFYLWFFTYGFFLVNLSFNLQDSKFKT